MTEVRIKGRPASPGLAAGPIVVLQQRSGGTRTADTAPDREAAHLKTAMAEAAKGLKQLVDDVGGEAGQILEFQLALLEDEALSEPAFKSIGSGKPADEAWRDVLQTEIDYYASATDEHFRARVADLKDLRDRVLGHLSGAENSLETPPGAVLVASDLSPSRFLSVDWSSGGAILLVEGSPMSHVGILARARGIPMIVGFGDNDVSKLAGQVLVDGETGEAIVNPSPDALSAFEAKRADALLVEASTHTTALALPVTKDGVRIHVYLNIASVEELDALDPAMCDGIGLVRSEFFFSQDRDRFPDEDAQYQIYRRILAWAAGRPVTIRTLDAGGDKPIAGFTADGESNPFLGLRGIRLSLRHQDIFRVQLRALIRAAAHGPLKIMLPMITIPQELDAARAILDEEIDAFIRQGLAVKRPQLGIMVEVPAVALSIETFDADFFSIGSNDLTQYTTAAGRDIGAIADLADPRHPGVLRLIEMVTQHGRRTGVEVSLCGDAGGDTQVLPHLLKAGLRSVSISPSAVRRVKVALSQFDLNEGMMYKAANQNGGGL